MCSVSPNPGLPNPQAMDWVPTRGQSGTGLHRRGASSSVFKTTPHHSYWSLTSHHHLSSASCQTAAASWDFPGKNIGMGSHARLQGVFPTQGSNPGLPHCRQILYGLSHQRSPLDSPRRAKPSVNCPCEGSRLCAPYENIIMPDDRILPNGELHNYFILFHI